MPFSAALSEPAAVNIAHCWPELRSCVARTNSIERSLFTATYFLRESGFGPGCVKTFVNAASVQTRTENRELKLNEHQPFLRSRCMGRVYEGHPETGTENTFMSLFLSFMSQISYVSTALINASTCFSLRWGQERTVSICEGERNFAKY